MLCISKGTDSQWNFRINLTCFADQYHRTPLHYSVTQGHINLIKFWFSLGVGNQLKAKDVNELIQLNSSNSILNTLYQFLEVVDRKKLGGKNPKDNIDTCDVSDRLWTALQGNFDSPRDSRLSLHKAAVNGNVSAVEILLKKGNDANLRDMNGWTPLHVCSF